MIQEVVDVSSDEEDSVDIVARKRARKPIGPQLEQLSREIGLNGDIPLRRSRRRRRHFVNSSLLCYEAYTLYCERNRTVLELNTPRPAAEISADPRYFSQQSNGDQAMKEMQRHFDAFGMERTFLQVMMHDLALNVMASLIYGDEWEQDRVRILEANNWRDYAPLMAAICARRFGKTVGVAMLAASTMLSTPTSVGCFAPTLRQSVAIMEECWRLLNLAPAFRDFKPVRLRAVEIVLLGPDGQERSLRAFPSTHKVIILWRSTHTDCLTFFSFFLCFFFFTCYKWLPPFKIAAAWAACDIPPGIDIARATPPSACPFSRAIASSISCLYGTSISMLVAWSGLRRFRW